MTMKGLMMKGWVFEMERALSPFCMPQAAATPGLVSDFYLQRPSRHSVIVLVLRCIDIALPCLCFGVTDVLSGFVCYAVHALTGAAPTCLPTSKPSGQAPNMNRGYPGELGCTYTAEFI